MWGASAQLFLFLALPVQPEPQGNLLSGIHRRGFHFVTNATPGSKFSQIFLAKLYPSGYSEHINNEQTEQKKWN
jgi:hypothetical protein